jgi:two-component system cell cycle sensor histidine kinase/response regulator CckA
MDYYVNTSSRAPAEAASATYRSEAGPVLESFVQEAPLAIVVLDRNARVHMWNRAAERIFGWTPQEALNRTTPVPGDGGEDRCAYHRALCGETVSGVEMACRTKDGLQVEIGLTAAPLRDQDGEIIGVVEWMVELTSQKRTLAALQRARETASLFEWEMGVETAADEASGSFRERCLARLHPEDRRKRAAAIYEAVSTGSRSDVTYRTVSPDGAESYFHERIEAVVDGAGRISRFSGAAREVTEHVHLQAQLQQAERLAAVGKLAGGVIHDFNNLITVVTGHNAMLVAELDERSPLRANALQIHTACERAGDLVRQLLAFSRGEAVRSTLADLNTIVHEVAGLLQPLMGKTTEWTLRLDPAAPRIKADSGQIHQALVNLILNARDAMPTGGALTIETAGIRIDKVDAAGPDARSGTYALLAVGDTGAGFDENARRHLFELFFTTRQGGRGCGLGLATVRRIVTDAGGWIEVHSEPQKGARVEIYLPLADEVTPAGTDPLGRAAGK